MQFYNVNSKINKYIYIYIYIYILNYIIININFTEEKCFYNLFLKYQSNIFFVLNLYNVRLYILIYWVVRKVRADIEGKLKRRRFKF